MMEILKGSPPREAYEGRILFSVKALDDGQWMGVVSSGGHPVVGPEDPCIVLDVVVEPTQEALMGWWADAQITKPWEPRQ